MMNQNQRARPAWKLGRERARCDDDPDDIVLAALKMATTVIRAERKRLVAQDDVWLTAGEIAKRYNVTPKWVYNHQHQLGGEKRSRRCLRFPFRTVELYLGGGIS